jgi:hypothetical protein
VGRQGKSGTGVPNAWANPVVRLNIPQETVTGIETWPVSESPQSTGRGIRGKERENEGGTTVLNQCTDPVIRISTSLDAVMGIETEPASESPQSTGQEGTDRERAGNRCA